MHGQALEIRILLWGEKHLSDFEQIWSNGVLDGRSDGIL